MPSCFYLAEDDPLMLAFKRIVGDIIKLLNHEIPQRWQMVCPFNIGNIQRTSQPAIAVLVQPLTEVDWSRIRRTINSLIDAVLPNATFDVEFLPGGISLLHPGDESSGRSFINRITATPKMGDSVGISDHRHELKAFVYVSQGNNMSELPFLQEDWQKQDFF
ncbi:hypothetical protein N7490_008253 [Penicillium lividum]|nr:hypothetical protein N7490_008253 [Penicillium lividum]